MILRSQLRMNKNIMFPFISCILIMLTLLVLIHKSADELNSVKKELLLCKQKHDLASSQLQNAIDYKLRLEQSLENEKTKDKQHADEMQSKLNQELEDRRKEKEELKKEKEEADMRSENLKHELEKSQSKNEEMRVENDKLSAQLEQVRSEKDKMIDDLKDKVTILENMQVPNHKVVENKPPAIKERVDLIQSGSKLSTTPSINVQAIEPDDSPKQVAPPPNNGADGVKAVQDQMKKSLDVRSGDDTKMDETVIKSPIIKSDEKKNPENGGEAPPAGDDKRDGDSYFQNDNVKNQQKMILPLPYVKQENKASSASNNAAERPGEGQLNNFPNPVLNPPVDEKQRGRNEIPKQMREYPEADEDDDFMDKNDIAPQKEPQAD